MSRFRFFLDAFRELGTCRALGLSPGPIPFTAIAEYSNLMGIEDFDEFLYVIRRMDSAALEALDKATADKKPRGK